MSGAPIGATVRIFLDTPDDVAPGHLVQTPTRRTYRVITARRQERGKNTGRWHLGCLVVGSEEATSAGPDDRRVVHHIRWYRRTKGRS